MDKYEYKVKTGQMLGYVERKQYQKAMEIADTIDWRRVKSASMLSSVSEIYEYNGENAKSRDILLVAFDRSPGSRKIIYRLGTLALKLNDIEEASDCYEEFVKLAPRDPNQYILKYKILKAQEAPLTDQISALEDFKKAEYIEKWAYELAKLYHEAGMTSECLEECDDLILWFSEGKYVYKAMELKMKYKPLTPLQQQKYDNRPGAPKKAVVQESPKEIPKPRTPSISQIEKPQIPKTANLREVISEVEKDETPSMAPPAPHNLAPEEGNTGERHSAITNIVTGSSLQEAVRAGMAIASGINIEEKAMKEKDEELRVNGQMMIDEILQEWEEKQKENAEAIEKQKEEDHERISKERAEAERRLEEDRLEVERKAAEAEEARKLAEEEAKKAAEEEAARKAAEEEAARKAAEEEAARKAAEEEAARKAAEEEAARKAAEEEAARKAAEEEAARKAAEEEAARKAAEEEAARKAAEEEAARKAAEEEAARKAAEEEAARKLAEEEAARKLAEEEAARKAAEEEAAKKAAEEEAARKAAEEEAARKAAEDDARKQASEEIANLALEAGVLSEEEIKEKFPQGTPQATEDLSEEISEEDLEQLMAELDEESEAEEETSSEELTIEDGDEEEISPEATRIVAVDEEILATLDQEEDFEETEIEEDFEEEDFEEEDFEEEDLEEEDFEEEDFEEENLEEEDFEEEDFEEELQEEPEEETTLEDFREVELEETQEAEFEIEDFKEESHEEDFEEEELDEEEFDENDFEEEDFSEEDFAEEDFEEESFEEVSEEEDFEEEPFEEVSEEEDFEDETDFDEEVQEEVDELEVPEEPEAQEESEEDLELPDFDDEIDEFREFDGIDFDDDLEDDFDADFEDDYEDDFEEDALEEEDFEEDDLEIEEPEEEEKISLEDLEIEEPSEEEIQERIKKSKGSGVPFDTGFVVTGRYDLSATSEIGLKAGLTEDQKKLFSYFVPVRGMSEQLVTVLDNDRRAQREGTSKTGNLIIAGRKGSGKTVLAVDIVKAIQKQRNLKQGKVAIVTGDSLNKKELTNIIQKLRGGAIIIEKAGKLNSRTIKELNYLMEKKTGELLFVLEDQRKPLERIMTAHPDFRKKFTSKLELPVFINDELVTFGQTYAKENGYKLDEMGILALYSRIDVLQREDHSVSVAEVKEIMDEAIEHSQKATAKHLARRVFGKGTDDSDRVILKEEDFKI